MKYCLSPVRRFSTRSSLLAPKKFLVVLRDYTDPECLQRRLGIRGRHMEEVKIKKEQGIVETGGALLDSHESGIMKGSMLVLNAESVEEAEKIVKEDLYVTHNVWESWDIYPFKK
ncbi:unnamed protein product [Rhizopus stolonifer]